LIWHDIYDNRIDYDGNDDRTDYDCYDYYDYYDILDWLVNRLMTSLDWSFNRLYRLECEFDILDGIDGLYRLYENSWLLWLIVELKLNSISKSSIYFIIGIYNLIGILLLYISPY